MGIPVFFGVFVSRHCAPKSTPPAHTQRFITSTSLRYVFVYYVYVCMPLSITTATTHIYTFTHTHKHEQTEETPETWRKYVHNHEIERTSTITPRYAELLHTAADAIRARHRTDHGAAPLLVNLGPPWFDSSMSTAWNASTWEEGDCLWESPPGIALCPLDVAVSVCARLHEHLSKGPQGGGVHSGSGSSGSTQGRPFAVLHARTHTPTAAKIATWLAICHVIYSCGFDSVSNALEAVLPVAPDTVASPNRILPGQRRYCDYLICMLHSPNLLPRGGDGETPIVLISLTFSKLSVYYQSITTASTATTTATTTVDKSGSGRSTPVSSSPSSSAFARKAYPTNDSSSASLSSLSHPINPGRIMLGVFVRGKAVWTGGVSPGSIDEDIDTLSFDFSSSIAPPTPSTPTQKAHNNNNANNNIIKDGIPVRGDIVFAVWFEDHKSGYERPAVSYAFHTAFVDPGDSVDKGHRIRIPARHLDVENYSYAELADKEGFYMDIEVRPCDGGDEVEMGAALGAVEQIDHGTHTLSIPTIRTEWAMSMSSTPGGVLDVGLSEGEAARMALVSELHGRSRRTRFSTFLFNTGGSTGEKRHEEVPELTDVSPEPSPRQHTSGSTVSTSTHSQEVELTPPRSLHSSDTIGSGGKSTSGSRKRARYSSGWEEEEDCVVDGRGAGPSSPLVVKKHDDDSRGTENVGVATKNNSNKEKEGGEVDTLLPALPRVAIEEEDEEEEEEEDDEGKTKKAPLSESQTTTTGEATASPPPPGSNKKSAPPPPPPMPPPKNGDAKTPPPPPPPLPAKASVK